MADIARSGVKVFASLHGDGVESVAGSPVFRRLLDVAETYIVLTPRPRAGTVREVLTAADVKERLT